MKSFQDIRAKYIAHIAKMFNFLGNYNDKQCQDIANKILEFETLIAEGKMDKVDRRDPSKTYNPRSILELNDMLPMFNFSLYLEKIGVKNIDSVIVTDLNYVNHLKMIFDENNVEDWRLYLKWGVLNNAASMLTEEMEIANWEFYSRTLRGVQEQNKKRKAVSSINWSTMFLEKL